MAKQSLDETDRYLARNVVGNLKRNFLAYKTKIRPYKADKDTVNEWLKNYFISDELPVYFDKNLQYFVTAMDALLKAKSLGLLQ